MEAIACVPCLSVSGGMLPAGYLRLWDASNDPWSDTTDSLALLDELTSYWNTNMRAQKRTVVYMARCVLYLARWVDPSLRAGGRAGCSCPPAWLAGCSWRAAAGWWLVACPAGCCAAAAADARGDTDCLPSDTRILLNARLPPPPSSGKNLGGGIAWMYGGSSNLQWTTACSNQMAPGYSADYCEWLGACACVIVCSEAVSGCLHAAWLDWHRCRLLSCCGRRRAGHAALRSAAAD